MDAFRFTNAAGHTVAVRWAVVPDPGQAPPAIGTGVNYLFTDVARQIAARPLRWHLMLTVADPSDQTADPTLPWPAGRRTIDAGVVTLDRVFAEADGPCMDINYDPLVLPDGMAPSDDPIPSARSSTYARSFTLRAGERAEKAPSAITPQGLAAITPHAGATP